MKMKVGDLIQILQGFNPDADVVIHRDVASYGFGRIDRVVPGVYMSTDYGNDFLPEEGLLVFPGESKAICFYAEPADEDA